MTKRYNESIEVEVVSAPGPGAGVLMPQAFSWRGNRYQVERLLKYWREAGEAWDPEKVKDHECFRVEAKGGTYDLRHDRLAGRKNKPQWKLLRVWD
ncbi:MAG TPA: DUF6504 family protein [Actinomycetota bacterium]|nr:DUF6504 family protein [Actinomycetota bacterium]